MGGFAYFQKINPDGAAYYQAGYVDRVVRPALMRSERFVPEEHRLEPVKQIIKNIFKSNDRLAQNKIIDLVIYPAFNFGELDSHARVVNDLRSLLLEMAPENAYLRGLRLEDQSLAHWFELASYLQPEQFPLELMDLPLDQYQFIMQADFKSLRFVDRPLNQVLGDMLATQLPWAVSELGSSEQTQKLFRFYFKTLSSLDLQQLSPKKAEHILSDFVDALRRKLYYYSIQLDHQAETPPIYTQNGELDYFPIAQLAKQIDPYLQEAERIARTVHLDSNMLRTKTAYLKEMVFEMTEENNHYLSVCDTLLARPRSVGQSELN